jgi:hypothetical protein
MVNALPLRMWAGDRVVFELSFCQGTAVMRANIVEREELAINFEQGHEPILDLNQHLAGLGKVGHFGNAYEVCHG